MKYILIAMAVANLYGMDNTMDERRRACDVDGMRLAQGSTEEGLVNLDYAHKIAIVVYMAKRLKDLWHIQTSMWQLTVQSKETNVWQNIDEFLKPFLSNSELRLFGDLKVYNFLAKANVTWLDKEVRKKWPHVRTYVEQLGIVTITLRENGAGQESDLQFVDIKGDRTKDIHSFKCNIDQKQVRFIDTRNVLL